MHSQKSRVEIVNDAAAQVKKRAGVIDTIVTEIGNVLGQMSKEVGIPSTPSRTGTDWNSQLKPQTEALKREVAAVTDYVAVANSQT